MKKIIILLMFLFNLNADILEESVQKWDFKNDYYILDVRTKQECTKTGVINGAVLVPIFNIDGSFNPNFIKDIENKFSKADKIAVICKSGARSQMAVELLRKEGFKNLVNLKGGMQDVFGTKIKLIPCD